MEISISRGVGPESSDDGFELDMLLFLRKVELGMPRSGNAHPGVMMKAPIRAGSFRTARRPVP